MRLSKLALSILLYSTNNCFAIDCQVQPSGTISELASDLVSVEDKFLPVSCMSLKSYQNKVSELKLQLQELEKKETGLGISDAYSRVFDYLKGQAKSLEEVFISCQKDLHSHCYLSNKKSISQPELMKIFEDLKKNPLLRSPNPGANCFERAYVISKIFAEKGYDVKITVLNAPIIIGQNPVNKDRFHKYQIHAVVTIDVMINPKQVEKIVIDPGFEDRVMSFEDYAKKTTGQKCIAQNSAGEKYSDLACIFSSHDPFKPVFPSGSELHTEDILRVKKIDSCGWAFNEESLERLKKPSEDPALKWLGQPQDIFRSAYSKMKLFEKDPDRLQFLDMVLEGL